jgi:hypothetical protein
MAVPASTIPPATNAQDAETRLMELRSALEHRRSNARSPYHIEAWERLLAGAGLSQRYPSIVPGLKVGFWAGIPPISSTYAPPNSASANEHSQAFGDIIRSELDKGRYIGPLSGQEVEALLGPFQTSPISIIPKPGRPGKYRLVQNFSHPQATPHPISSINSHIDANLFPCTWGTFPVIAAIIWHLPPGSQGAVRDVSEAYRTIPLAADQWPGMVVRLPGDQSFALDLHDAFGLTSGAGCHGQLADAAAQLFRWRGMGPIAKYVDDHVFFRIPKTHIAAYNKLRREWSAVVAANGGAQQTCSRIWYPGMSPTPPLPSLSRHAPHRILTWPRPAHA